MRGCTSTHVSHPYSLPPPSPPYSLPSLLCTLTSDDKQSSTAVRQILLLDEASNANNQLKQMLLETKQVCYSPQGFDTASSTRPICHVASHTLFDSTRAHRESGQPRNSLGRREPLRLFYLCVTLDRLARSQSMTLGLSAVKALRIYAVGV